MAEVDTTADLASELFDVVGRFRRQLRRSAGRGFDATGLTQSQAEMLRLVGRQPGISVREAATELGLVPNTASTLVSKLAADGLLIRSVDADDRRVGRLRLTAPRAAHRRRVAGRTTGDAGRRARRVWTADQIDRLEGGLGVLTEMTRMLQKEES